MSQRGFTLIEVLIALALTGIVLLALFPSFLTYLDVNTRNEIRSGGIAAAQQVIESLRREDPALLPDTGSSGVEIVPVGDRSYEAVTFYCSEASFCTSRSRHLLVEVSHGGRIVYSVETVFAQLR